MEQLKTIRYITQDPLSNLKLKVTLKCLSRTSKVRQRLSRPPPPPSPAPGNDGAEQPAELDPNTRPDTKTATDTSHTDTDTPENDVNEWSRNLIWQEKVFSKAEADALKAQMMSGAVGEPGSPTRRQISIGPQSILGREQLAASTTRNVLFSYVHHDKAAEDLELSRTLTTSASELQNPLVQRLLLNTKSREKVLNFKSMYIMADLTTTHAGVEVPGQQVLVHIKSFSDGSFEMTPGFSKADTPAYRFEDGNGRLFEYRVENASASGSSVLEAHIDSLTKAVAARASDIQHSSKRMSFAPVPQGPPTAMRLVVLAEIISVAGFLRDNLYIDFAVSYSPAHWQLASAEGCAHEVLQDDDQEDPTGAIIKGSTQVSKMVQYKEDIARDRAASWVAHFAHPVELEWVAGDTPPTSQWPIMYFKVMSYDTWDRYAVEGYGWMPLAAHCPGTGTHYINTWKPEGSKRDQVQEYFIGGSQELEDVAYLAYPSTWKAGALSKYGFKTTTAGVVKVRINSMVQQVRVPKQGKSHRPSTLKSSGPSLPKTDLSLAVVVERARSRLMESRTTAGMLLAGTSSQLPLIRRDPCDVTINEGGFAELEVDAAGAAPLRYQWYKDSKALTIATADSPLLVIASASTADSGSYFCRISNASGSEDSSRAKVTVKRVARLGHHSPLSPITPTDESRPSTPPSRRTSILSSTLSRPSSPVTGRSLRTSRLHHPTSHTPVTGSVELSSPTVLSREAAQGTTGTQGAPAFTPPPTQPPSATSLI